jgi:hypothetical protein
MLISRSHYRNLTFAKVKYFLRRSLIDAMLFALTHYIALDLALDKEFLIAVLCL